MAEKIRIGDPGSLIKPGDPIPNSPGKFYQAGMYAPKPELLTSLKLQEVQSAGLLKVPDLDIYEDDGSTISEDKVEKIDYLKFLNAYGIKDYNRTCPQFALIGLLSSFGPLSKKLVRYAKIEYLDWADPQQMTEGVSNNPEDITQVSAVSPVNTQDKNLICGYKKYTIKSHTLTVFQPFFNYLSIPIVPAIPNHSTGLSASTVSLIKVLGYMIFDNMKIYDQKYLINFLEVAGWSKYNTIPKLEFSDYAKAGEEIGINKTTLWYRDTKNPSISLMSTLSPKENFSELLLQMYFQRLTLQHKNHKLLEFFDNFIKYVDTQY